MANVAVTVTPTQTIFAAEVWDVQVNLTFLNPIEVCLLNLRFCFKHRHTSLSKPQDWVKQSIPFSYIAFTANSKSGIARHLQVYTDISGGTWNRYSSPSCLQLYCRMELGGSKPGHYMERDRQLRYRLPQRQTPDASTV
jgi:hypothetical protein